LALEVVRFIGHAPLDDSKMLSSRKIANAHDAEKDAAADDARLWNIPLERHFQELASSDLGLSQSDAEARLRRFGANVAVHSMTPPLWRQLLSRLGNPLVLVLLLASLLSAVLGDVTSFVLVVTIVAASVLLDLIQERKAHRAVEALRAQVAVSAHTLRDGQPIECQLETIVPGDVVLLNSDTIVAPGFVDRLAAVARSAPNIGTVTPLSNNGDIFSFPIPNEANPMPSYEQILEIDRVAGSASAGDAIDVPSGIGFCLYVTRACLDAVGGLSETFDRGYLEDVDLCLRARAKGFRNVCAPSVYVGHHGSKSFQHEKRSLVLRNLGVLDQRFPSYRKECHAFEIADPLRPARAALERALPWSSEPSVLIVGNQRSCAAVAEELAHHLRQHGERAILLLRERDALHLRAPGGTSPQAIHLRLGTEAATIDAADILARLRAKRVEIVDPNPMPHLIDLMRKLNLPLNFWLIKASLGEAAVSLPDETPLLVPSKAAKAFAQARWPKRNVILRDWPTRSLNLPPLSGSHKSLVIVPSAPSPASLRTMRRLADCLQRQEPSRSIVIAGTTCDDDRLMSYPNVFMTGAVVADQLGDVLAPHDPGWLLTDFEEPIFGHPLIETAKRALRPVAYRDWSSGSSNPREGDLAIPANVDEAGLVDAVVDWVGRS
jgi:hypothetical protein